MISVIAVMHLPADNLAAIEVEGEVEVKPLALHLGWQISHVPTPHLARFGRNVRGQRSPLLRCLGAPAVSGLAMGLEHQAEVDSLVW